MVDRNSRVISGVSVVTSGVEAVGHGIYTDLRTLETVKLCADEFADGVRVKANHGTGVGSIIGSLKNFRIDGDKLIGDLHLLENHELTPRIMELAAEMPSIVGLSISFSQTLEKIGGKQYARCEDLFSVDLVDRPAANPSGLFQRVDSPPQGMDSKSLLTRFKEFVSGVEKEIGEPTNFEAKAKELETQLSAKATEFAAIQAKVTELEADKAKIATELEAAKKAVTEFDAKVETAASAKAQGIMAQLGIPPQGGGTGPAGKKDFAALVAAKAEEKKISKGAAVALCVKEHPAEYATWRASGNTATL